MSVPPIRRCDECGRVGRGGWTYSGPYSRRVCVDRVGCMARSAEAAGQGTLDGRPHPSTETTTAQLRLREEVS